MIYEKKRQEEKALAFKYKATEVPKHVKDRRYEKLQKASLERREENKRLAVAKIKATEAPFKFYERDVKQAKLKQENAELPANMGQFEPFRAGKIPWRVLVPLYQGMVEDGEQEREKRVKKNAQVSLSLSKLPPRMELDEKKRAEKAEEQAKMKQSQSFSFRPPLPKQVPDFKRLHREFS